MKDVDKILKQFQKGKYTYNVSLCLDCANAACGCSWSRNFTPVKGWKAVPTQYMDGRILVNSYLIFECPLFKPDRPYKYGYEISLDKVAKICGCCLQSVRKWSVAKLNDRLHIKHPNLQLTWYRDPMEDDGQFYINKIHTKS